MFVTALTALAAASVQPAAPPIAVTNSPPPIVRVATPVAATPKAAPSAPPPKVLSSPVPNRSTGAANPKSSVPDYAAMMKMFDKMFPPQPAPDPARLALARTTVETLWPNGTYGKMMGGMMGGLYERALAMKLSDLEELDGKKAGAAKPGGDMTLHDMMRAEDPKFDEQAVIVRKLVAEEFDRLAVLVEPKLRGGLANAYARRFDARQLTDINAFFATDSGKALGSQLMMAWADSDVMRGIMSGMPDVIAAMPGIMVRVQGVMAKIEADKKASKPTRK